MMKQMTCLLRTTAATRDSLPVTDNHSDQRSSNQGWRTCYRQLHSSDHRLLPPPAPLTPFLSLIFLEVSVTSETDKSSSIILRFFYKRSFVRFVVPMMGPASKHVNH
eukprot:TRINITY_DN22728_c1_g1_i1.p1 TRINITY_DN22728_c1_g1~~TRINITY_DN22728_c1_g1_i1.p1  ORF type:complete len:107 (+),score=4.28 TRINITY_DN22728_c1_g1_i1:19-339(+)